MECTRCGLQWDTNDPDPPLCRSTYELAREQIARVLGADDEKRNNNL